MLITTIGNKVATKEPDAIDITSIQPCLHEEADTRLLLHAHHARITGYENILIRTVDTDVLVIAVAMAEKLGNGHLWLLFGKGNSCRYINVNATMMKIGPEKSQGLPIFHALTDCDTVSSFSGIGKKMHGPLGRPVQIWTGYLPL